MCCVRLVASAIDFYLVHKVVLTSVISIHDQLSTILHETAGVQNPSLWNVENLFPLTDREMKMSIVILVEIADQDLQESMKITVFHTDDRKPDVF